MTDFIKATVKRLQVWCVIQRTEVSDIVFPYIQLFQPRQFKHLFRYFIQIKLAQVEFGRAGAAAFFNALKGDFQRGRFHKRQLVRHKGQ
ncbi:hypothetical protein [Thiothrix subterranea]|uniref:hypothetical protein n=1 Tax=Thiothrix subterranea TaxID=2735563 RepID=UPI00280A8407|nr:hypothetical protein [Thiothrix subterranea]